MRWPWFLLGSTARYTEQAVTDVRIFGGNAATSQAGRPAAAILAGGLSSRLGEDKIVASLGGVTVLEWQRDRLLPLFPSVFVVTKDPSWLSWAGIPVVADALRVSASAVGVYTAVLAAPGDRVLCLACDMPFVPERLLVALAERSAGYDVLVPRHGDHLEPLCAVYSRTVLPPLEAQLARGANRIDLLYAHVRTAYFDLDDGAFGDPAQLFLNVNTPEELARARIQAGGMREAGLESRVASFIRRVPVPVISFVGKKKSGKTSVLVKVVEELVARGHRIAALKHHPHELEVDIPGTDSHRLKKAGAAVAELCGRRDYCITAQASVVLGLEEHIRRLPEPVDMVVTEGFKSDNAPKIEVSRRARSQELVCDPRELLAIVSDQEHPAEPVPHFRLDDAIAVADFVERWAREVWPRLRAGDSTSWQVEAGPPGVRVSAPRPTIAGAGECRSGSDTPGGAA